MRLKEVCERVLSQYGWKALVLLPLHPLLLPAMTPIALFRTFQNMIPAFRSGNWKYYTGNNASSSLVHYFYAVQDFNVQRFGRYGMSQFLGGGGFSLKALFHMTPFSLRLQAAMGTSLLLTMCMFGWVAVNLTLVNSWGIYAAVIMIAATTNTLFYANFIDRQNYNILGWVIFPSALHAVLAGNAVYLAITAIAMAFCSYTSTVVLLMFCCTAILYRYDWILGIALVPAVLRLIIPTFQAHFNGHIGILTRAIGLARKAKYIRKCDLYSSLGDIYLILLWISLPVTYYFNHRMTISMLFLALPAVLYGINQFLFRFADQQTFYLTCLSVSTVVLLQDAQDWWLLTVYIFSINPIYAVVGARPSGRWSFNPPVRKPINTAPALKALIDQFLASVPINSRIWLAYNNPQNAYSSLFDGYRILLDPLQYAAHLRNIVILPDWYFIFQRNKQDSKDDWWGRDVKKVEGMLKKYSAEYVVLYTEEHRLENEWNLSGFSVISNLSWSDIISDCQIAYEGKLPYWWLLKKNG